MLGNRFIAAAVVALTVATTAGLASAAFTTPTDWTRPADSTQAATDLTTYQAWTPTASPGTSYRDVAPADQTAFDNVPDTAANPNGVADVYDADYMTSGSFIASSSGSIYSQSGLIAPESVIPSYNLGAGYQTRFFVQATSYGSDITPGLAVGGVDVSTLEGYEYTELSSVQSDIVTPGGSFTVTQNEHLWEFTVDGSAEEYLLSLDWTGGFSTSFGAFSVDTQTIEAQVTTGVPEPASALMLGIAAAGVLRRRRTA